ncbi:hypothetical protein HAX54_041270 [Datura stramonium]|uniref:Uncharacterized protein n=1 Tax=Datura stramonium TaxID=4076 RepID=A0ABS8VU39_DATST|nr:hypothetical protein [Datura stramonium]
MAGNDSQKQFLTLIREFASEKSQAERRIINHKKRNLELQLELEVANAEVQEAKHQKETAEQELKGYEVELARNESAIQTLEEGMAFIQDELSAYGSNLEALKVKIYSRDDFIEKMLELNAKIRKFHESMASILRNDNFSDSASKPGLLTHVDKRSSFCDVFFKLKKNCFTPSQAGPAKAKAEDVEAFNRDLQNKLAQIVSQITKEEEEFQAEQDIHRQASYCVFVRPLEEELSILERKVSLIEGITKENMEMQESHALDSSTIIVSLTGSKQTSELENRCSSLGDELQRRSVCPRCHKDNTEALGEILQAGDEN